MEKEKIKSTLSKYVFVEDVPKNIVKIPTFPTGNFGRDFLEEYRGRAKADFNDADVLNVFKQREVVTGSNSYAVVLANQILRQEGLRTPTPADIERILKSWNLNLNLNGVYVDTALVLRSRDEPNQYLARDLIGRLSCSRYKKELPVMIPLAGLDLRFDEDAPHGLAFNIREDAEIIYDKILNSEDEKTFSSEDINEKTGLPKKLGNGDRRFYTSTSGLSRFCLGGGSDLGSSNWDLDDSYDGGRVVVVKQ